MKKQLKAIDIASFFLHLSNDGKEDALSNLKLQKLCYYAQGFHLAMYNKPLFNDRIEAWKLGPVVPDLYRELKNHGNNPVPVPESINLDLYSNEVKELLGEIYSVYGQYSAWKLVDITHQEAPWIDYEAKAEVIPHDAMKMYFKTQLIGN